MIKTPEEEVTYKPAFHRQLLCCGSNANPGISQSRYYLMLDGRPQMSTEMGWPMLRSGSILSVGMKADINAFSSGATLVVDASVNDSVVLSASVFVEGNIAYVFYTTQKRDIDTFSSGDLIQCSIHLTSGGVSFRCRQPIATIEIEYDD